MSWHGPTYISSCVHVKPLHIEWGAFSFLLLTLVGLPFDSVLLRLLVWIGMTKSAQGGLFVFLFGHHHYRLSFLAVLFFFSRYFFSLITRYPP